MSSLRMSSGLALVAAVLSLGWLAPAKAQVRQIGLSTICAEKDCRPEKVVDCDGFLEGVQFDRAGVLWMVGYRNGSVMKVVDGKCVKVAATAQPNGAKFHRDGRLFVADGRDGLLSIDPATGKTTVVRDVYSGGRLRGTNDLVFDKAGGAYFTEPYGTNALNPTGRLFYLPPGADAPLMVMADNMAFPNGVALSPDEKILYVSDYGHNQIINIPLDAPGRPGPFAGIFARLEGGAGPDGLAMDTLGNVYAAHFRAGEVVVVNPQGFVMGAIRLPPEAGTFVTNVALHEGYLYLTEAQKNQVWRVKVKTAAPTPFHLQ